ncbi:MAG: Crp/Fnr family transcriptional regulator, partial [Rubrimonas sp.]
RTQPILNLAAFVPLPRWMPRLHRRRTLTAAREIRALIAGHAEFRDRALAAVSSRIVDLVEVIDELLLRRVDLRLASWLAERAGQSVTATHQALAAELGTAREVVSRILKDFERRGWVSLGRGRIEIIAAGALRDFSAGL